MIQQQHTSPATVPHNIVHSQSHHQASSALSGLTIPQTHQQLSWSCELCGRMFSTRDEWSLHAKSHLEVSLKNNFFIQYSLQFNFFFFFFCEVLTSGKDEWIGDK